MKSRGSSGLVLGKFMPLHAGHVALMQFAQAQVEQLYIVVDHLADAVISGEQRCEWIRATMPNAHVLYLPSPNPQQPEEHPDFWHIWRDTLLALLPEAPEFVFASETYGLPLAKALGASFIPYDLPRSHHPMSASRLRENLYEHWDYLAPAAKPDYVMRVCIFGPESTGKTTLARELAEHFDTVWVPEYARTFIESRGKVEPTDMLSIAQNQMAMEREALAKANRFLFSDTDPLMTALWHQWLFGACPAELEALAARSHYDLTLMTEIDLPWIADKVRYFPENRQRFKRDCLDALARHQRPFVVISGSGDERLQQAVACVKQKAQAFFSSHHLI